MTATDAYGNPGAVATGELVESAWGNASTTRGVKRFPNVATRDSAYPAATAGNGATCVTTDTSTLWVSTGVAWVRQRPSAGGVYGITHYQGFGAGSLVFTTSPVAAVGLALGPFPTGTLLDVSFSAYVQYTIAGAGGGFLVMTVNGVKVAGTVVADAIVGNSSYSGRGLIAAPAGAAPTNLMVSKELAGGSIQVAGVETWLSVVAYQT